MSNAVLHQKSALSSRFVNEQRSCRPPRIAGTAQYAAFIAARGLL
jgi:hypothetical protein